MESLYVCLFSNGQIKVGRTRDLWARIRTHADRLACTGAALTDLTTWECRDNPQGRERWLIDLCVEQAEQRFQDEWFLGLDFNAVRAWAAQAASIDVPSHYAECQEREPATIHADAALIERIGTAQLARLLNTSIQRVHNWKTRGIPLRVRVDHSHLFAA